MYIHSCFFFLFNIHALGCVYIKALQDQTHFIYLIFMQVRYLLTYSCFLFVFILVFWVVFFAVVVFSMITCLLTYLLNAIWFQERIYTFNNGKVFSGLYAQDSWIDILLMMMYVGQLYLLRWLIDFIFLKSHLRTSNVYHYQQEQKYHTRIKKHNWFSCNPNSRCID